MVGSKTHDQILYNDATQEQIQDSSILLRGANSYSQNSMNSMVFRQNISDSAGNNNYSY
jgi:hypothetical protein